MGQGMIDRVDVAIIFALELEAAPLRDRLEDAVRLQARDTAVTTGRLGDRTVAIAVAGMGMVAARATRQVIDGHRPGSVIAAGLCGGLSPDLDRGALVVADRVAHVAAARPPAPAGNGGEMIDLRSAGPVALTAPDASALERLSGRVWRGLVVTADAVVATPDAKRRLADESGAVCVDMESWWIVDEAIRAGRPAGVVRAVSDTVAEAIPADIARLAGMPHAMRRVGAAMRLLWRRPGAIVELAELRDQAHRVAAGLAVRLVELLA
jgi:adenosylhomocysteine nucleosidase